MIHRDHFGETVKGDYDKGKTCYIWGFRMIILMVSVERMGWGGMRVGGPIKGFGGHVKERGVIKGNQMFKRECIIQSLTEYEEIAGYELKYI